MIESSLISSTIKLLSLVVVLFFPTMKGVSQKLEIVNKPRRQAPFVVVIYDDQEKKFVEDKIRDYKDDKGTSFLLVSTKNNPVETIKDSLNNRLNYTSGIDLLRCYLLILGDEEIFDSYKEIGNTPFFSAKYYLHKGSFTHSTDFSLVDLSSVDIKEVIHDLSEKYLWGIRLEQIQQENVSDLNQNAIETGVGIRISGVKPAYGGIETGIKPFFRTFSLNFYHRWSRRWQTNLDATLGLNLPSQNRIQNQIQSAASPEEEIEVTIQAHILRSAGLETRYLFLPTNKKLNPYLGIRLGVSSINATESTIEVDPNDISSGSFDRPDGLDSEDFELIRSSTVSISSGFQLNVSPKLMIESGIRWSNDVKNLTEVAEPYFNNLSLSIGFNFRFTGRKKLFYDFIPSRSGD